MGIFSASQFETDVEKATNEKNVSEEWSVIMEICDKIQESPQHSKEYLRAIFKRLNHQDPHIVMQALSLLDACVNNCGKPFHLEVASREFEAEFKKLVGKSQPKIAEKLKSLLKKWAEGEFKKDTQLTLIPSLYAKLVKEGVDFSHVDESKPKQSPQLKDPNAVSSQKEVEDIAKAIELSLQDTTISSVTKSGPSSSSSLYPSPSMANSNTSTEGRKVRALYDFEAAEENELTFSAGEIIQVLDDTDSSWWEGCNQRGRGLFPSNFVTDDLTVEPENTSLESEVVVEAVEIDVSLESTSSMAEVISHHPQLDITAAASSMSGSPRPKTLPSRKRPKSMKNKIEAPRSQDIPNEEKKVYSRDIDFLNEKQNAELLLVKMKLETEKLKQEYYRQNNCDERRRVDAVGMAFLKETQNAEMMLAKIKFETAKLMQEYNKQNPSDETKNVCTMVRGIHKEMDNAQTMFVKIKLETEKLMKKFYNKMRAEEDD